MDFNGIAAISAALTLIATVAVALFSLKEQRRLATKALAEHRLMASEERVWNTRSVLYVDLLVWLEERSSTVNQLRRQIEERRHAEDSEALQLQFQELRALLKGASSDAVKAERAKRTRGDPGEDLVAIWDHFRPPVELRERLRLFGSKNVEEAFEAYKATQAMPLIAGGDVNTWVVTLESVEQADDLFRKAVVDEMNRLLSSSRG